MKNFVIAFLIFSSAIAQTKDIKNMSGPQKKLELIETLKWIQSKTGKDFKFFHAVDKVYRYNYLTFDEENPNIVTIQILNLTDDSEHLSYIFNLKDIYTVGVPISGQGFMSLFTYSEQRLITLKENDKYFITDSANISYDNIVKNERMEKALNYAIKLADGGKKILKEKF